MNLSDVLNLSIGAPPASASASSALKLPSYALDGRKLNWNETGTAVWFESTEQEYHSDQDAASASALKLIDRSPAHFVAERRRRLANPNKRSPALFFGTAVHSAVLEPHLFRSQYQLYNGPISKATRLTKAFKEFEASNPTKRALLPTDIGPIRAAAINVLNTEVICTDTQVFTMQDLVQVGAAERVYYWLDAKTGLTCKARMDLVVQNIIIDIKTTMDARSSRFRYDAAKFGYHIQSAFYLEALRHFLPDGKHPIMLFLAVEKQDPYATKVFQADEETFWGPGEKRVRQLLEKYKKCIATNHWPAYAKSAELLRLPASKLYEGHAEML